jgi:hypothetical protein
MAEEAKRYDAYRVENAKEEVQNALNSLYPVTPTVRSHLFGTPFCDTVGEASRLLEKALEQLDELPIALE